MTSFNYKAANSQTYENNLHLGNLENCMEDILFSVVCLFGCFFFLQYELVSVLVRRDLQRGLPRCLVLCLSKKIVASCLFYKRKHGYTAEKHFGLWILNFLDEGHFSARYSLLCLLLHSQFYGVRHVGLKLLTFFGFHSDMFSACTE